MALSVQEQTAKVIEHADKHGIAAINEEDYSGEEFTDGDAVVKALMEAIKERDQGDVLLATGANGTVDLTDGYPEEGLAEAYGGGCGSGLGSLIYLFISFTGKPDTSMFVPNQM